MRTGEYPASAGGVEVPRQRVGELTGERPAARVPAGDGQPGPVDELKVRRAAAGDLVRLTPAERAAAARVIIAAGGGPGRLSARLHLSGTAAARLYTQLSGFPSPGRERWLLPDDGTVDEVRARRAAAGGGVRVTRAERAAAARMIIANGGGPSQLSARLHLSGTAAARLYTQLTGRPPGPVGTGYRDEVPA